MYKKCRDFFDLPDATKRRYPAEGPIPGGFEYLALGARESCRYPRPVDSTGSQRGHGFLAMGLTGLSGPPSPMVWNRSGTSIFTRWKNSVWVLRGILASAAGLAEDFFEPRFEQHLSSIRAINYPALHNPSLPGQLRAGAHTDYGFLTVLLSEDKPGGLEVQTPSGDWLAPPQVPGTFVVNLGDCLARWTNDLWSSTPHRVVNPPADQAGDTRRQSLAFFHNPARDAVIDTLPTFPDQDDRIALRTDYLW